MARLNMAKSRGRAADCGRFANRAHHRVDVTAGAIRVGGADARTLPLDEPMRTLLGTAGVTSCGRSSSAS
jgi:hypothetical protein